MKSAAAKADALLMTTALIWGLAFVAQRVGMEHVGPLTFNGVRFALGALALLPVALRSAKYADPADFYFGKPTPATYALGGLAAGAFLFAGATLQQVGLVYTTAGKAGFITGLYVVIVPLLGLALRQRPAKGDVVGAALAAVGLYYLSVTEEFTIAYGDVLELVGAFFWAGHVLIIGRLSPRMRAAGLACAQYSVCAILSLATAAVTENMALSGILDAAVPILYGGLMSVGLAYTLQVVAQRDAKPTHAAIILSLESVFAALAGWIILGETLGLRSLFGCALMLGGMLISQLLPKRPA